MFQVAYDSEIVKKLGSADKVRYDLYGALVHLQSAYCLKTLGSKIQIQHLDIIHFDGIYDIKPDDIGDKRLLDFTKKNIGNADLMVYISAMPPPKPGQRFTAGIAFRGVVCDPWKEYLHSINEHQPTHAQFGGVSGILHLPRNKHYYSVLMKYCFFTLASCT